MKQLSKQLLAATKLAQEAFLKSILSKESKCCSEFYKNLSRHNGNRENIPAIKDCNGRIITDAIEKASKFNSSYSTVFSREGNVLPIQGDIKTIRRRIKVIGKNKSVGPDRVFGEILKLGGEAMFPYLARLLDITMNNGILPGDWKRATVIPIHKVGDRSLVTNYGPVCLISVVCKQMEHVIASYLRQMCDKNDFYARTMEPYVILNVKNALVNPAYFVIE